MEGKVIRTYPVLNESRKVEMAASNDDVMKELNRLRGEIQQLREVVNALFNAVFEESDEEWNSQPEKDEFNLYN
jgi:tetrahydromethanopterin S-methyltransferase subunit B